MLHLLKRLELNGFKSFAQKTVLEFPAGITAIVGPNGSGKSNVIDAIRWLLGERDTKNLRGAKAEDLIFAGTPKRARLGQAQATLHFENTNNFFSLDFPEIAVSRQVNRDGLNKFFLNSSELRLRDLIDFFAKARLGSKGLVVITQGNSDMFIKASSAGRREMIEEILGLREYQLKKSAAERRVKNTQINLEKIDALMKEILPHLRSLKRQTGRWEKRETLERELRNLENTFFGLQYCEIENKISGLEKEIGAHREELKLLQKEKEVAEANLKKVELSQPQEREEMTVLKKEIQALLAERSQLQKELGRLEAQLEIRQEAPDDDSIPAQKLIALVKKIKNRLDETVDQEIDSLRSAVKELLREIQTLLAGAEQQRPDPPPSHLNKQLTELNKRANDIDKKISEHQRKETLLEKSQEDFYRLFKKAIASVEAAKEAIEKWEDQNRERFFEKERLELRFSELQRQILQAGRNLAEFKNYSPAVDESNATAETADLTALERKTFKLRGDLASIGEIDEALLKEATETEERYHFLEQQFGDLEKARTDLKKLIRDLSQKINTEFKEALEKTNEEFNKFFHLMFDGGRARLAVSAPKAQNGNSKKDSEDGANPDAGEEETGIEDNEEGLDIIISLPRKKINSLETLSGGERSLVGIATLFALVSVSPPPFLVLDEIDAALDSRNSNRFAEMLKEFSKKIQFVVVTHNRAVMETADILYGVTLNEDGTSKIVSLKLEK